MSDTKTAYNKNVRQVIFFILWAINRQGFWQVAGTKVKFRGTFRDKFVEKSTDFAGIFGANFGEKQSVKYSWFCGYFWGNFR